jgi:hypothetical protein
VRKTDDHLLFKKIAMVAKLACVPFLMEQSVKNEHTIEVNVDEQQLVVVHESVQEIHDQRLVVNDQLHVLWNMHLFVQTYKYNVSKLLVLLSNKPLEIDVP